ncbi:hypothetical protein A2U01_0092914, partial [Trifolium medium]|nr:hypothetical protein [Trifolium medium]
EKEEETTGEGKVTDWTGGAESDLVAPPPLEVTSESGDLD